MIKKSLGVCRGFFVSKLRDHFMLKHDDKCTSLRDHLSRLQSHDELHTICAPVSGNLELAALVLRYYHNDTTAAPLLFTAVAQSNWFILANLFGTKQRTAQLVTSGQKTSLRHCSEQLSEKIKSVDTFCSWLQTHMDDRVLVNQSSSMPTMTDLYQLPRLRIWSEDAGSYLSMAVVIWRNMISAQVGCGLYRVQIHSDKQASVHWRPGSNGANDYAEYQQAGVAMPVTIILGGDPALTYAAAFPLPRGTDKYKFAAFLQQSPVESVVSEVNGLPVPARCECVLEGEVQPHGTLTDGPFGNHQGFYSQPVRCPIFYLKRASACEQAIFPVSIVGPPPSESGVIGATFVDFYLPLLKREIDQLLDIHMPQETVFHGCAFIRLRVDAMLDQVKDALRSSILLRHSKLLIYVDEEIDVRQPQFVFWRVINQLRPDIVQSCGGTMEIDATAWRREQRLLLRPERSIEQLLDSRWCEYGVDTGQSTAEKNQS